MGNQHSRVSQEEEKTTHALTWMQPDRHGLAPSPRNGHTADMIEGKLYIFGGGDKAELLNELFVYDCHTGSWSQPAATGDAPSPRSRHISAVVDKQLFIWGGIGGGIDVHLLDISCDFVTVGVWDAFGTDRMNITRNVQKQRIDHKGSRKGHPYNEDEIAELEFSDKSFSKEELAELDSDWGSSSDKFKHNDFQAVVDAHDFTMVNFYADWCPHCRQFAPLWTDFENKINSGRDERSKSVV